MRRPYNKLRPVEPLRASPAPEDRDLADELTTLTVDLGHVQNDLVDEIAALGLETDPEVLETRDRLLEIVVRLVAARRSMTTLADAVAAATGRS